MKLPAYKLNDHLKQELAAVYVVSGDDALQVRDACDAIRARAREAGFTERSLFSVDIDKDPTAFLEEADNLSLFAERKVIDVRLPAGKTGKEWATALGAQMKRLSPDTLLLISGAKLERSVANSAWYKAADKAGVTVTVWPMDGEPFRKWIRREFSRQGLRVSANALQLLVQRTEGNSLAAEQEISKLALLYPGAEIGEAEVISAVANSSRYSPFDLVDAALAGDILKVVRILNVLEGEGVAPYLLTWTLSQEVRKLAGIAQAQLAGMSPEQAMKNAWIPRNRLDAVRRTLGRLTESDWLQMQASCSALDRLAKGQGDGDIWQALQELAMQLAGKHRIAAAVV
ncbi:DNA polymerase III subunit delta [Granulosicoccaceae sp. 1_MG-2023]|nr:DNA polymerase III subunit delta [Granulosicoccaceae sp. 1_MG-2023]